jgi:dienelactone hydrolase
MLKLDESKISAITQRMRGACSSVLSTVTREEAVFWSDRCRLAADLWLPRDTGFEKPLPGLLLVHGRGDTKEHMNVAYAPRFAALGVAVMTFDHRGWGESEGRVTGGQELRQAMNPQATLADIRNAFAFLSGDYRVDVEKTGIWASSLGARHALQVAIEETVPSLVIQSGNLSGAKKPAGTQGQPRLNFARESEESLEVKSQTRKASPALVKGLEELRAATLIIDAEEDEYFEPSANGLRLYESIEGQVDAHYETVYSRHYDMFTGRGYQESIALATEWLSNTLVNT